VQYTNLHGGTQPISEPLIYSTHPPLAYDSASNISTACILQRKGGRSVAHTNIHHTKSPASSHKVSGLNHRLFTTHLLLLSGFYQDTPFQIFLGPFLWPPGLDTTIFGFPSSRYVCFDFFPLLQLNLRPCEAVELTSKVTPYAKMVRHTQGWPTCGPYTLQGHKR